MPRSWCRGTPEPPQTLGTQNITLCLGRIVGGHPRTPAETWDSKHRLCLGRIVGGRPRTPADTWDSKHRLCLQSFSRWATPVDTIGTDYLENKFSISRRLQGQYCYHRLVLPPATLWLVYSFTSSNEGVMGERTLCGSFLETNFDWNIYFKVKFPGNPDHMHFKYFFTGWTNWSWTIIIQLFWQIGCYFWRVLFLYVPLRISAQSTRWCLW